MKKQIVLETEEYEDLLNLIKDKEKIIKELENKSFIVVLNSNGSINYIKNAPNKINDIYNHFNKRLEDVNDSIIKSYEKKDDLNNEIEALKIEKDLILNKIKDYNNKGSWHRFNNKIFLND